MNGVSGARSLHAAALDALERDPPRLPAIRRMLRRLRRLHPEAAPYLADWEALLCGRPDALRNAVLDPGPRGRVLRSSSPLAGVLEAKEREKILRQVA